MQNSDYEFPAFVDASSMSILTTNTKSKPFSDNEDDFIALKNLIVLKLIWALQATKNNTIGNESEITVVINKINYDQIKYNQIKEINDELVKRGFKLYYDLPVFCDAIDKSFRSSFNCSRAFEDISRFKIMPIRMRIKWQ
jgi:hypothetical protein